MVEVQCRLKKRHPDRYRSVLIAGGNFHAFGHFMFGGHEAFFDCYTGIFARVLHKTKVPKLIPDFENDAYTHVLAHHLEVTIGNFTFFLHDVTDPPPQLFVSDPVLYVTMIKSAGGLVAYRYLQYAGVPVLNWLRAGRTSDGGACETLHALAFHMNRSTTHKTNCVLISILSLISTLATHDELAAIVKACASFSITGGNDISCSALTRP